MNGITMKDALRSSAQTPMTLLQSDTEKNNLLKKLKNQDSTRNMLQDIKQEATRLTQEKEPELSFTLFKQFKETGTRKEYETAYFSKRRRLNTFAIMTLLEQDNPTYKEELENAIWSICNEYTWCLPAHIHKEKEYATTIDLSLQQSDKMKRYTIDLFAAETGFALSEIITLTEDIIDPLLVKRVKEEIYHRIFWPFQNETFHWETAEHNWASVCAGSIGAAALYLLDDEDELASILERVLSTMDYYLQGFQEDGVCLEGYGYWQYGFGYFTYFADLIKKKTNGEINLFASEKVHEIARFQQACFIHNNITVNFSDTFANLYTFPGLSHYLKRTYQDIQIPPATTHANYTDDHCSRWAPAIRNLLWVDDSHTEGKPWPDETIYFPHSQWFISKHTSQTGHFGFATKGGHNDEPHNHNDMGHFMLYKNGQAYLSDIGSGLYTREYFGQNRYNLLCNGSHGHSVPIINGIHQSAGKRHASIEDINKEGSSNSISINMTDAYDEESLTKLVRTFSWEKSSQPHLTLVDSYQFSEIPSSMVERFISPVETLELTERGLLITGDQGPLHVIVDREKVDVTWNRVTYTNHFGKDEAVTLIDITWKQPSTQMDIEIKFQWG
ncbi:heparinase II/III family protein [Evansella sp. AB-rgal1]|uniref:heparinase II/III domain-containing protein n=1 Tax=Evansella sp. AB-rgal1 TaxID=3242696 RepID=UPI00359EC4CB